MIEKIVTAVGKRKTSVAKVFFKKGEKNIIINNKSFPKFFTEFLDKSKKLKLFLEQIGNYTIVIFVKGGGVISQPNAIILAIAKAICTIDNNLKNSLKKNQLLTCDSRIKERRKYGLKKARKASQYSKR